jgi:glycosyltransferase involved in cell wall biosynthesis
MRILIAHSFYRIPGGEDRYVRQQLELLRPHHDVELLSMSNADLDPDLRSAARMVFSKSQVAKTERVIRDFAPDVIHLHNAYPSLGPAIHMASAKIRVPLVQTVHNQRLRCPNGLMFTHGQRCSRCEAGNYVNAVLHACLPTLSQSAAYAGALWTHRFVMRIHRTVTAFIAPSRFMQRQLHGWGIPPDRVELIPNFVRTDIAACAKSGERGVYVGRLSAEKGLVPLILALQLAGDPPFRIIGDGPLRPALERLAARIGLQHLDFPGRIGAEDVAREVCDSRFLVMPSECEENAPLAVLEAMARGRPVIVSRLGGLPELAEGGTGLIFGAGDTDALARHIRHLSSDERYAGALGSRARRFIDEHMSPDVHRRRLEAVYRKAAPDSGQFGPT